MALRSPAPKDNFWPHKFKVIKCLERYINRKGTNYDWNPDEGCDRDDNKYGDSDYKDDDNDKDNRRTNEKYINKYDLVETKVYSNGNDIHYDINNKPTGDISASTIIYFTAILGIKGPSLTFYPAHSLLPKLSALIKYLLRGCYTPFGELIKLKAFAKSIVKQEEIPGNDKKVFLSEFCKTYYKAVITVQEQVNKILLGWQPDIDETLLHRLQKSLFQTYHKYLSASIKLNKSAFAAIHFRASLPGRGTEVTSIRYLNSKLSICNMFFYDRHIIIIISYNKARASNNYAFYIEFLAETMHSACHDSKEFFFLDPNGRKKHLSSNQASDILRSRTQDLITPWTLSLYRQAALVIAKRYLAKLVEKSNFYYPSSAGDLMYVFAAGAECCLRLQEDSTGINAAMTHKILIYIAYESIIQPRQKSFYSHLNKLHCITRLAYKALIKRFSIYKLCSFQELAIPRKKVQPVPGLAIHTAFKCNICIKTSGKPYFTLLSDKVRDYIIIH
ncbi:hypothetical protein QL093DRAFT_2561488 [Fusarium oxysporum]|nr:hypothetical protein QL093DRAFT_2570526 [Fusarium oxysporum]KAJ9414786.1 hypothetical protein QL093DRAFT_2568172 [Fusarium oxysporum]KAJ9424361.1 hypothetical protein QL093DRAFT_2561488 [Fusarium oxysporum]